MNRILCSTGCLLGRPNGRDFNLLPKIAPLIDCDGLELLMYDTWYGKIPELKRAALKAGKDIFSLHIEKSVGESISHFRLDEALEKMEINCTLAKDLGAKTLVFHLWNGIISDKNIDYNIECFKYVEEIASKYSLDLTVENVVCSEKSPMAHMLSLISAYPHIKFTYDTKMADFHKEQDLIYDPKYRHVVGNFAHMHINDRLGEYKDWSNLKVLPVGKGSIDFERFFAFIKSISYKGDFTTEATSFDIRGDLHIHPLNESLHKIRNLIS